jgi:hypothetical protein
MEESKEMAFSCAIKLPIENTSRLAETENRIKKYVEPENLFWNNSAMMSKEKTIAIKIGSI